MVFRCVGWKMIGDVFLTYQLITLFGACAISKGASFSMTNTQPNWEQFALLLIDIQGDFWSEQAAKIYPDFPANIVALLTLCRNEGMEVVHLRASFKANMSDWMPKYMLRV